MPFLLDQRFLLHFLIHSCNIPFALSGASDMTNIDVMKANI